MRKQPVPNISLIIPTYRDLDGLRASLRSLPPLSTALEVIVVSDGGDTPAVQAEVASTRPGTTVLALADNQGPSAARNAGWQATTAPWITFLDAGDLWLPGRAQQLLDQIAQATSQQFHTWSCPRKKDGDWHLHYQQARTYGYADFLRGCRFQPGSTLLIEKAALAQISGYAPELRRLEDYDLFLRLAQSGWTLSHHDNGCVAVTEAGGGSLSTVLDAASLLEARFDGARDLRAALALERAASYRRAGQPMKTLAWLVRSFAAKPRLRLQLQTAERRAVPHDLAVKLKQIPLI